MKQTAKRILALLCVTVMLFTCCLSGFTFAAAAESAQGGTTAYGSKWTIFYSENGEVLNYTAGGRFEKSVTGFNAVIPETYKINDLAVYIHMTLDQAAVTAFEKGGSVELSQATMDQAERNWSLATPEWTTGDNYVLLPLGSSGSAPGSAGVAFDLYQPINYFRMFANPNAAEFAANSSVTVWEIAIVDKTAAGVQFGTNDTYLKLSNPITATPNTIEASVKVEPFTNGWQIGNGFTSSKGFNIGWSSGTSAVTYNNLWKTDDSMTLQPAAGTPYAEFKPNGKTNTSGSDTVWCPVYTEEFNALDIPKSVELDDLVFSGWMYVSDASAVLTTNPWIWLASSDSYATSSGGLTYKNMWVDYPLKDGWNYFELPLSEWAPSSASYPLYKDDISGISVRAINVKWQEGTIEDQVTVRYADFKLSLAEKEEEEEAGPVTEWSIGYPNGGRYASMTNIGAGVVGEGEAAPAGTKYFAVNVAQGGNWAMANQNFTVNFPETVTSKNDLALAFWMYTSTGEVGSGNIELTSSGTWDKSELCFTYKNYISDLKVGWNYVELPLASPTSVSDGDTGPFDYTKANYIRWVGGSNMSADTEIRISEMKFILLNEEITEWYISKDGSGVASGSAAAGVSNGDGTGYNTLPAGLAYTIGSSTGGGSKTFTMEIPTTYTLADLALSMWLWVPDESVFAGTVELTSAGKADIQEWELNLKTLRNEGKITIQNGWNYLYIPLSWDAAQSAGFNLYGLNFMRIHSKGGYTIGCSDVKIVSIVEEVAENEELLFSTNTLGNILVSNGNDGLPSGMPYVEKDLSSVGQYDLVMQPSGVNVKVPENTSINDMVFSFWLWVNDADNVSGTGQIELTSSGTCDQQELGYTINKATLKDGWNHIVLPLSKGTLYSGSQGVAFDHTAINYMRWYGLYGANLKVKFSHFSIYVVEDEENPTWSIMNLANAPQNWDGGSMTAGQMWTNDGTGAAQPLDGTVYLEVKPGSGVADIGGVTVWKAGFVASTGNSFIAPNIPSYYNIEDLTFSFWLYVPDVDLLPMVSGAPNFQLTSAGTFDKQALYYSKLLADGIQGEWKDGWNYIELPLSKMGKQAEFDLYNLNFLRWSYFPMYYSESGNDVVRFADFRITANVDKTPAKAEEVSVTEDDMIIIGNTNTADENPIALFLDLYGNVCWVWGDKQYTTEYNAATGEWIDLALVRDMAENTFYLYANGELVEWRDASGTTDIIPTVEFTIGADGLGDVMNGMIADVRLWSDARTATEIAEGRVSKVGNKDCGFSVDEQGLIDAWFLVGDLSHVLGDSVTNSLKGNDLVFMGSRADDWLDYDLTQYDFLYDAEGNPNYYTMVFIPDIQNLVTGKYTDWLMAEGQWIADNVEKENIVHVMGAGDTTWSNTVPEYERARAMWALFEDKVSWSNIIGNHDYVWSTPMRDTTRYNTYFGLDYIQSTEGGQNFVGYFDDPYGISGVENAYYRFKVNGVQWMIMQLEFHPRAHVLDWANEILAQYPHDNVILTTHSYLDGKGNYAVQNYTYINGTSGVKGSIDELYGGYIGDTPEKVWTDVAYKNPNVKMVLCGHSASSECEIVYREDANIAGYKVPQMMINAQNLDNNDSQTGGYFDDLGVGLLGIMRFSADGTQVAMQYYSPYYDLSYGTTSNDITLTLDIDTTCVHENTTTTTVDADCDTEGSVTVTCDDCGVVVSTETIPATGHINTTTNTTPADCDTDGLITVTCECGTVVSTTVIPALGHTPADAANGKDATCTEDGYTGDTKCSVCGDTITAGTVIPATGHINTTTNTTPADCDTDGLITVTCECGTVVSTTVIPALGHTKTVVNAKDAVINGEAGYTGDVVCDVCDELISEGKDLVVTFVDGYYAENGKPVPYKGMIKYNGNLYYIGSYSRVVTGRYAPVTLNGLLEKSGVHYFDETGALVRTGVYDGYYYKDGKLVPYAGMVEVDGDLYYVVANGAVKTGRYAPVTLNGFAKGNYYFGADGKALRNEVKDGFYYGNDGRCIAYRGLVIANDGNYYYVKDNGAVVKNNAKFYVTTTNGLVNKGFYAFDAEGKMSVATAYVKTAEQLTAALANGKDIVLEANVNMGSTQLTVAKDTTLNLNGYTISGVCEVDQDYLFMVNNGVTLNILDSSAAKAGKITYAAGSSNVGWAIDLNGALNLYSGTIELTGSWSIGYAVDVRPNAWGSDYKAATVFTMYGGSINSSDGAVRVASTSDGIYTGVSAHFVMNGGAIVAGWDGVFIQQSNSVYDILKVELNAGSITASYAPIRFYGPNASSVVGNAEKPMSLTVGDCELALDTPSSQSGWYTEDILIGGGMSVENLETYTTLNLS